MSNANPHLSRWASVILIVSSLLSIGFMVYHPVVRAKGLNGLVEEFANIAFVNALVHGSLIALMWLMLAAFSVLCTVLNWNRFTVRAAFMAACLATITMTGAALVSGFIIPEFVANFQARTERSMSHHAPATVSASITPASEQDQLRSMLQIMSLARSTNQVCSKVGVLAMAVAWLLWSFALFNSSRWIGALGMLGGVGLAGSLLTGLLPMNVHGMLVFAGIQTLWNMAVGWLLWRYDSSLTCSQARA